MNENHRRVNFLRKRNSQETLFALFSPPSSIIDVDDDARITFTNKNKRWKCVKHHDWLTWSIMDNRLRRRRRRWMGIEMKQIKSGLKIFVRSADLTNSSQVSSRNPLFCLPLKFLSQMAGRDAMSVINLSTSKFANAASELIALSSRQTQLDSNSPFLVLHF